MTWIIAAVEGGYELRKDGNVVKSYGGRTMTHPDDWFTDAVANGANAWEIMRGDYQFKNERE